MTRQAVHYIAKSPFGKLTNPSQVKLVKGLTPTLS